MSSAGSSYLFVNEISRFRYVQRRPDSYRRTVQMARTDFRHVTAAVDFLVFLSQLIVVVGFEREFRAANGALETAAVEETEIFQRAHAIHLINSLVAPQTGAFVKIWPVHRLVRVLQHRSR